MLSGARRHVELLQLHPPGSPAFVLAANPEHDRYIVPQMRSEALWAPTETLLLLRILQAGMHVIDIGAHIGYFSVLCSLRVGLKGSVRAFEPEPENFCLLKANLLLNQCANVCAEPIAIADSNGHGALYLSEVNSGDHRLLPTPERHAVDIATITLDAAIGGCDVDFIKIDTQGCEPRVIAGMGQVVEHNRKRLACLLEFSPFLFALAGTSIDQFVAQLAALDARIFTLSLDNGRFGLHRMADLAHGFDALAHKLARHNEVDAGEDVLILFSADAERAWGRRYAEPIGELHG